MNLSLLHICNYFLTRSGFFYDKQVWLGPTLWSCFLALPSPTWQRHVHCSESHEHSLIFRHTEGGGSMLPLNKQHIAHKPHLNAPQLDLSKETESFMLVNQETTIFKALYFSADEAKSGNLLKESDPCFLPTNRTRSCIKLLPFLCVQNCFPNSLKVLSGFSWHMLASICQQRLLFISWPPRLLK